MNEILPHPDWSNEDLRPALVNILRRLDKMFNKIAKKHTIRVSHILRRLDKMFNKIIKKQTKRVSACPVLECMSFKI